MITLPHYRILSVTLLLISAIPLAAYPLLISGHLQTRYSTVDTSEATQEQEASDFYVSRACVAVSARLNRQIGANALLHAVPKMHLMEAYGSYSTNDTDTRLGLSRIPFGYEPPLSSAKLITLEHSEATRRLIDPFAYDRGAFFTYRPNTPWSIAVGVVNGATAQTPVDPDARKNVTARVRYCHDAMSIGLSAYTGTLPTAAEECCEDVPDGELGGPPKNAWRYDADAEFTRGPLTIIGEVLTGDTGGITARGGYLTVAYRTANELYQPYCRLEQFDPNIVTSGDRLRRLTIGCRRYLAPSSARITLEYAQTDDQRHPEYGSSLTGQYEILF